MLTAGSADGTDEKSCLRGHRIYSLQSYVYAVKTQLDRIDRTSVLDTLPTSSVPCE